MALVFTPVSKKVARESTDAALASEFNAHYATLASALEDCGLDIVTPSADLAALEDIYPTPIAQAPEIWAERREKAGKPANNILYKDYTNRVAVRAASVQRAFALRASLVKFLAIAEQAADADVIGAMRSQARRERRPLDRDAVAKVEQALETARAVSH